MRSLHIPTALALTLLVALASSGIFAPTTASRAHAPPPSSACEQAEPRSLLRDERAQLCRVAGATSTAPALCAATALRATNAFPAAVTKHQRTETVIALCAHASGAGPALCWLAFPSPVRQQRDLTLTLLQVCRDAPDSSPAECFLHWRKLMAYASKAVVRTTAADAAAVCSEFRGSLDGLSKCTQQSPPSLSPALRFQLCRYATSADKLLPILACAKMLVTVHSVSTETVVRTCALATANVSPQECVVAAARQLRWMDEASKAYLCERASSDEPVKCALALHRLSRQPGAAGDGTQLEQVEPMEVAQLCRETRNGALTVACVMTVPAKSFTLAQRVQLCSGVASRSLESVEALVPASRCVETAKRLLGFFALSDIDTDTATLLVQLCDGATTSAPTDCLQALLYDNTLSLTQRVQLCSRAQSSSPHESYVKLRHFVHTKKLSMDGALALSAQAQSLAPALCATDLARVASTSFMALHAATLCGHATSAAPVQCFRRAPSAFSDSAKAALCHLADSDAPSDCAHVPTTRIPNIELKAELCHRAQSSAPAACAMAAPFGMPPALLVALCRSATSESPATCARSLPVTSLISWATLVELCVDAVSTTPAHCLSYRIRQQRRTVTRSLIDECRAAVPAPASLEIAQVAYRCRELVPKCRLAIQLRVHDQFGAEMHAWTGGYLRVSATPTAGTILVADNRVLHGPTHALIVNGSATFADIFFAEPGEFVVTFAPPAAPSRLLIAEKVARIRIHEDAHERLRSRRCNALFTRLECGAYRTEREQMASAHDPMTEPFHLFELPSRYYLDVLGCEGYWLEHAGGLRVLGATSTRFILAIHPASYRFLTCVPVAAALELLVYLVVYHHSDTCVRMCAVTCASRALR